MFHKTIKEFKANYRTIKLNEGNKNLVFTRDTFSIDGALVTKGWTAGDTWNGWECPYFEKDEAEAINKHVSGYYDESTDSYKVNIEGEPTTAETPEEMVDTFESQIIKTPEGDKKVWAMGAYSWVWDKYDDQAIIPDDDTIDTYNLLNEMVQDDTIDEEHGMYDDVKAAMKSMNKQTMYDVLEEMINNGIIDREHEYYKRVKAILKKSKIVESSFESADEIQKEITKLEKENAEGYADDIKKLKIRLAAVKLMNK